MTYGNPWSAYRTERDPLRQSRSILAHERPGGRGSRACLFQPLLLLVLILLAAPSHAEDPKIPMLRDTDASSAIVVKVDPRCAEPPIRMPQVKISWTIDTTKAQKSSRVGDLRNSTEVRVDVSMFRGGLEDGRFEAHHSTAAKTLAGEKPDGGVLTEGFVVVPGLRAAVYHSARVLVRTPDGWVASETVEFLTPICPVDEFE